MKMGDSTNAIELSPTLRALKLNSISPGAHAPCFMLPPASQAKPNQITNKTNMPEPIDFEQAVAALSPRQRELLADRLRSDHERLLAYVVPKPNQRTSVAELRQFLQEQLPDYMVPADFIV